MGSIYFNDFQRIQLIPEIVPSLILFEVGRVHLFVQPAAAWLMSVGEVAPEVQGKVGNVRIIEDGEQISN